MVEIRELTNPDDKAEVCGLILKKLPGFGDEADIRDYVCEIREMSFYAAFSGGKPIGFTAVKTHNLYAAEVFLIAILKECQHKGIGRRMMENCLQYCTKNNMEFLSAKLKEESKGKAGYAEARLFFNAMGFRPLEIFRNFWDGGTPCLYVIKHIG